MVGNHFVLLSMGNSESLARGEKIYWMFPIRVSTNQVTTKKIMMWSLCIGSDNLFGRKLKHHRIIIIKYWNHIYEYIYGSDA